MSICVCVRACAFTYAWERGSEKPTERGVESDRIERRDGSCVRLKERERVAKGLWPGWDALSKAGAAVSV